MQRLLKCTSKNATDGEEILELLSSLLDINDQNEDSILQFQHQLVKLSNERDGARDTSDKLTEAMTKHRSEWEDKLRQEREGFASMTKVEKWKHMVQGLENELKAKEGIIRLCVVRDVKEKAQERCSTITDTTSASTVDTTLDGDETAPSEIEINWAVEADDDKMEDQEDEPMEEDSLADKDGQQLKCQLKQLQCDREQMEELMDEHLEKIRDLAIENSQLLTKCQQLECDNESMKADGVYNWKEKQTMNDELVEKIGDLAVENGQLVTKCQRLERDLVSMHHATEADDIKPRQSRRVSFDDYVLEKRQRKSM